MSIRDIEGATIQLFLEDHASLLTGDVLDYGCGKQPYRQIVERAGGQYHSHDRLGYPASVVEADVGVTGPFFPPRGATWDAVICTQVIQYVPLPYLWLEQIRGGIKQGGWLLMTGPTNWPVVEKDDLHRYTVSGVEKMLVDVGFGSVQVEPRGMIRFEGEAWLLGWQADARA